MRRFCIIFLLLALSSCQRSSLKVLSYNICEAMQTEQENQYRNFIVWVRNQDPDIFCIQEANEMDEKELETLAAEWGHPYVVTNYGHVSSHFPVAVTSRYEIQVVNRITQEDSVYHGGIHARIQDLDIVILHLYPFKDIRPEVRWDNRKDLDGDHDIDGDDYRVHEISIYLDKTVKCFPERTHWLMMGDFNSVSPSDSSRYASDYSYGTHRQILQYYQDLIRLKHPDYQRSVPSTGFGWQPGMTGRRIDFMYGSPDMAAQLLSADFLRDDFTEYSSDHYPISAEFRKVH